MLRCGGKGVHTGMKGGDVDGNIRTVFPSQNVLQRRSNTKEDRRNHKSQCKKIYISTVVFSFAFGSAFLFDIQSLVILVRASVFCGRGGTATARGREGKVLAFSTDRSSRFGF